MSEEYTPTMVAGLSITEDDKEKYGVSTLRQTPNRGSTYGTNGLSADDLKKRFDKLPIHIADRLNLLISMLADGTFKLGGDKSISELLASVGNGALAAALKLSSGEDAKSLNDLWCDIADGDLAKALKLSDEGELADALNSKAGKAETEKALAEKANAKDVETSLKEKSAVKLNGILQSEIDLKDYATKTDLRNEIGGLVGDAPKALDTLYEIARLIGTGDAELSKTLLELIGEAKAEAESANRALSSKAEKSALTAAESALRSMVTSGLEIKADKTTVSTELGDLRKRVVNLEHGLTLDPFRVDNDVAYTKTPPEGVLPYARILEVGGRSTVHKNLFDLAKLGSWGYSEGGAYPNDNGGVNITTSGGGGGIVHYGYAWGSDEVPTPLTDFCDVQVGKTYTLSCVSDYGAIRLLALTWDGGVVVMGGESKTFVMTQAIIDEGIQFEYTDSGNHGFGDDFSYTVDQIMLVEGTVAGEYIANAIVTSIDVVGENKLPYPYPLLPNEVTVDGLTITPRADGSILLDGTLEKPGSSNYLSVYLHGNPTEGKSLDGSILTGQAKSTLFLEPGYHYVSPKTVEGAAPLLKRSVSGGSNNRVKISQSDSYFSEGYVFYLSLYRGTTFDNVVLYPFIVKGEVAPETWTPYACERVEIPAAVRALPGYGMGTETYYNRVVWNDDGTVSYIRAVDDDGNVIIPAVSTDVTEHFSGSNVIKVGPDTTITAVNERRLPVPFSIKYQLKQYVYE